MPPVLLSGHHINVAKWKREQSILRTAKFRPDLLEKADLSDKDMRRLAEMLAEEEQ